ncbi:hypothetical protein AAC387_Pa08g0411 [Persea americana]
MMKVNGGLMGSMWMQRRDDFIEVKGCCNEKEVVQGVIKAPHGFASGSLDEDASSVRSFVSRGLEVLITQSYSKNLGLYAERIGAINVVCSSSDAATRCSECNLYV